MTDARGLAHQVMYALHESTRFPGAQVAFHQPEGEGPLVLLVSDDAEYVLRVEQVSGQPDEGAGVVRPLSGFEHHVLGRYVPPGGSTR